MAGDWESIRLGELSEVITKGTTPTTLGYRFTDSGINFVKSESVTFDGWIDRSKFAFIEPETHEALKRSQLQEGDILFSMAGVFIGKTAVVPKSILPANTNQAVGIVRLNKRRADPRFIDYFLRNPSYNLYLNNLVAQSAQPNLNLTEIRNLPIKLPPLSEQKRIAEVLGALDDKIELNRRMNATLEATARALFQSWFVDFDPVRAKLDGRQPSGMDAATAALFPDSFEESELGHIPKGWEVVWLEALASIRGGKQLPTEDCLSVGRFAVFGANGIMGYATESTHNGFVIAFGRVGAYCGSVHWSLEGAWINNNASAVVPFNWAAFVLQTILNIDFDSMRTGSAQPFIPNSSLASARVLRPSPQIAEAFSRIVMPLRQQQADNDKQSRTLATLRDTLLPKLLSGEILVKEAA